MINSSKVGRTTDQIAIHGYAMDVGVPDIVEMDRKLGLATSILGARPCLDPISIFKSRDQVIVKG